MRECQQCGEANQASARFCVVCGAPLSTPPANPPAASPPAALSEGAVAPAEPAEVNAPVEPVVSADPAGSAELGGATGRPEPPPVLGAGAVPRELGGDFPVDGPRTLVGFIVSYENVDVGQYWPIHRGRNVVGRQGAATGLDIEIAHPTTSSLHALLLAASGPGRVVLEDTGSTNGTFVNDNVLAPGQRWELRDGDRVRFGLFNTIIKVIRA